MKKLLFIGSFLSVVLAGILFSGFMLSEDESGMTVHEWGTFTTLHGSDGNRLSGLHIEEELLPPFVYQHGKVASNEDHAPISSVFRTATKMGYVITKQQQVAYEQGYHLVGRNVGIKGVNVKMETPVLYFYSKKAQDVHVKVDFPRGSISQWYPQRTAGETLKEETNYDFNKPFKGWIEWDAKVLAPDTNVALTPNPKLETLQWTAPRATAANLVEANGEVEKFLFYRGMANFDIPLTVGFNSYDDLFLTNTGQEDIPFVLVYEKKQNGQVNYWWTGKLGKGEHHAQSLADTTKAKDKDLMRQFEQALVDAGLYRDEAKSMLRTWDHSYFQQPGLRAFWIVPEAMVDRLLPLQVIPKPAHLKRVFVGRCDIMKPELEQAIMAGQRGELYNPRHYLGYQERMKQIDQDYLMVLRGE